MKLIAGEVIIFVTLAALSAVNALLITPPSSRRATRVFSNDIVTGPEGKAAASKEEDLALTLRIILDHEARSTTVSKEQFLQQMEEVSSAPAKEEAVEEVVVVSVPYNAAAQLAYDKGEKTVSFHDFLPQYLAGAVAHVKSKQQQPEVVQEEIEEKVVEAVAEEQQQPSSEPVMESSSSTDDANASDADDSSIVCKGSVKWFDKKKGFGFLTRHDDGTDVFVHQSQIQADGFRSLDDGADVEFGIEVRNGRNNAIHVTAPNGVRFQRGHAYKKRAEGAAEAPSKETASSDKKSYYF